MYRFGVDIAHLLALALCPPDEPRSVRNGFGPWGKKFMDPRANQRISPKVASALDEVSPPLAFNVCLAGSSVSNNWTLIESLKRHYQVTVIESFDLLLCNSILSSVDVLVLDCEEGGEIGIETLRILRSRYQELCIVLVNGGLSQNEIAAAFREGARDYFPHHFNVPLLVERVHYLGSERRRQQQY